MNIITNKERWNKLVLLNNGSFLQSWEWGSLQEKLGRKVWRLNSENFIAAVISYNLPFHKSYFYSPRGPIIVSQPETGLLNAALEEAQKLNLPFKPIFFRIEPDSKVGLEENWFKKTGFKKTEAVQPGTTLILDLTKSEIELLREMEHDTRYSIRTAVKRGVRVKIFNELGEKKAIFEKFWQIFQTMNKRRNLAIYPREYYEQVFLLNGDCSSSVFFAELNGEIISAAIVIFFGRNAVYLSAASAAGYGKFNAPTLILWEAIVSAKERGCCNFDLWGISHTKLKWLGITAFKKSFGGEEVSCLGTWDFIFDKKWYFLYNLSKKLFL